MASLYPRFTWLEKGVEVKLAPEQPPSMKKTMFRGVLFMMDETRSFQSLGSVRHAPLGMLPMPVLTEFPPKLECSKKQIAPLAHDAADAGPAAATTAPAPASMVAATPATTLPVRRFSTDLMVTPFVEDVRDIYPNIRIHGTRPYEGSPLEIVGGKRLSSFRTAAWSSGAAG